MSAAVSPSRLVYRRQTPSIWQSFGRAVWDALEAIGRRRAARELHGLAQRWAHIDPALAAQLRAAAQSSNDNSKDTP